MLKSCDQGTQSLFKELKQVCSEWSPEKGGGGKGATGLAAPGRSISVFLLRVSGNNEGFQAVGSRTRFVFLQEWSFYLMEKEWGRNKGGEEEETPSEGTAGPKVEGMVLGL